MRVYPVKAFTLIELLVVIAIIALLLAILMPALQKTKLLTKYVVCASNQKQVLIAISTYSSDNDMKLPPTVQDDSNPTNYLINTDDRNHITPTPEESSIGYTLKQYLPVAKVFMCPASPFRDKKYVNLTTTGPALSLQEHYIQDTPTVTKLYCSYGLFWNYDSWKEQGFNPVPKGNHRLMIVDILYTKQSGHSSSSNNLSSCQTNALQELISSHPVKATSSKGVNSPEDNYAWHGNCIVHDHDGSDSELNVPLNAGYFDGHVERTWSRNWKNVSVGSSGYDQFIPKDW
jgi:prepilin-type N-terminal cleavage/methylation domain-containing protein/prepilin-type processing-associated H-X9-DG protein